MKNKMFNPILWLFDFLFPQEDVYETVVYESKQTNFEKACEFNTVGGKEPIDDFYEMTDDDIKKLYRQFELIEEEVSEIKAALDMAVESRNLEGGDRWEMAHKSYTEIRDGIADALVVIYGLGYLMFLDTDADYSSVHKSNMSKFCLTEEEAGETIEKYSNDDRYDSVYYTKVDDFYVVKNKSTDKILKSVNYKPPIFEESTDYAYNPKLDLQELFDEAVDCDDMKAVSVINEIMGEN